MHWWLHIVWAATHPTCSSCTSWVCARVMTLPGPGRVKHFKVGEVCGFKLTLVRHPKGLVQGRTSELWGGNERMIACLCLKEELERVQKTPVLPLLPRSFFPSFLCWAFDVLFYQLHILWTSNRALDTVRKQKALLFNFSLNWPLSKSLKGIYIINFVVISPFALLCTINTK